MSSILQAERELYEGVWTSVEDYGKHAPGEQYLPLFLQMATPSYAQEISVIDAGSGSGKGALALKAAGYDVQMVDVTDAGLVPEAREIPFTQACLWHPLRITADYVYCCDVLEHIPPQFTMLSVQNLLDACDIQMEGALFLTVSLVPDNFGMWAGKPLHRSVFPFTWWRDALKEVGEVIEARDLVSNAVFFVRPR